MFWETFEARGAAVALVDDSGDTVTYAQLDARCREFGAGLHSTKSLVLVSIDNSIECIVAVYGALRAGHAVVLADALNPSLLASLTATYAPTYRYARGDDGAWTLTDTGAGPQVHADLALLVSTSGSTGSAKCVRISRANLEANTRSIVEYLGLASDSSAALTLPIHYCYGLSVLNSHLAAGGRTHVGDVSVAQPGFFDFLRRHAIGSFAGVPYSFEILERAGFRSQRLPDLRFVTQAGGRLPEADVRTYAAWAETTGKRFYVMYGQTEATARIAYVPPQRLAQYPGCIGVAIPGGTLGVLDAEGRRILTPDTPGELVYEGPNVMMGYAEAPADLARGPELDALRTGDIGAVNADGLYYITGRAKRFAKIYGKRFNLDEIEQFLQARGASVVCNSDDRTLYLTSAQPVDDAAVAAVVERYAILVDDIYVHRVETMPLLASGKIDYGTARRHAEDARRASLQSALGVGGDVGTQVRQAYARVFPKTTIADDASFTTLGGDSLRYVGLSIRLEEILGTLPADWQDRPVAELAAIARPARATLSLESGIVLRALAIVAVVAQHAGVTAAHGGAALLMFVAGVNFARFQWDALLAGRVAQVVRGVVVHVALPYWLIVVGYDLLKHRPIDVGDLFFLSNITGLPSTTGFFAWFIQALIQSMLLVGAPLLIAPVGRWGRRAPLAYAVTALVLASALRALDGRLDWGGHTPLPGAQTSWVLWQFTLGLCVYFAATTRQRWAVCLGGIALAAAFYREDPQRLAWLSLGLVVLSAVDRVPVGFRPLRSAVSVVASASFFIYLLHLRVPPHLGPDVLGMDSVRIVGGVAVGVAAWWLYERAGRWLARSRA